MAFKPEEQNITIKHDIIKSAKWQQNEQAQQYKMEIKAAIKKAATQKSSQHSAGFAWSLKDNPRQSLIEKKICNSGLILNLNLT